MVIKCSSNTCNNDDNDNNEGYYNVKQPIVIISLKSDFDEGLLSLRKEVLLLVLG